MICDYCLLSLTVFGRSSDVRPFSKRESPGNRFCNVSNWLAGFLAAISSGECVYQFTSIGTETVRADDLSKIVEWLKSEGFLDEAWIDQKLSVETEHMRSEEIVNLLVGKFIEKILNKP